MVNLKENQLLSQAGDVLQELDEIKKVQADSGYFVLSISTNTCGEYYTILCC